MEKSKGVVIFSIDIEARGQGPASHGIISIGVCVGSTEEEKVLEKIRFDMLPIPGQKMEERCREEFWSKHPDHLKALTKNAKPPMEQTRAFRAFLDKWDMMHDLYIVCDHPTFDFGMINYYLDKAGCFTLNYKKNLDGSPFSYRPIHDSTAYARSLLRQSFNEPWLSNKRLIEAIGADWLNPDDHDHMPENDAEFNYRLHYQTVTYQVGEDGGPLKKPKTESSAKIMKIIDTGILPGPLGCVRYTKECLKIDNISPGHCYCGGLIWDEKTKKQLHDQ